MSPVPNAAEARSRLARLTANYASVGAYARADGTVRHKCFISYHSADAVEALAFVEQYEDVIIPRSIGISDDDGDIIDSDDVDYVMDVIRTRYLADTTVTLVLVGQCTWARRYIDWEVYSSLRAGKNQRINGLAAIQLPSVANQGRLPARVADNVIGPTGSDGYARHWQYPTTSDALQSIVDDAFAARTSRAQLIANGRDRRRNSASCP